MVGQGQGKGPDALFNAIDWRCKIASHTKPFATGQTLIPGLSIFILKTPTV